MAINPPTIGEKLVDGGTYVLFNYAKPSTYWSTTSWDGSYYLLDYASSNWRKAAFTAHHDDEGWYFASTDSTYIGYNLGDANLKGNLKSPAHFIVSTAEAYPGYYKIVCGMGQPNGYVVGLPVHLNNGGQYVVTTFNGNQWFPDCYGGEEMMKNDDGTTSTTPYIDPETNWIIPNDTTHFYWAFADTAKVASYHNYRQLYDDIVALQDQQDDETYGEGVKLTITTLTAVYEKTDLTADDVADAETFIKTKQALRDEIALVQTTNATAQNATLTAAITAAINSYNTAATIEAASTALNAITTALNDYNQGKGDLTSLGQNMSFEDLSAQSGSETSSVSAVPTGWHALINGKEVSTADDVKAAGMSGWFGVNSDAEGALDGKDAFGIWASSVPELQIYQTITGLDNGTYTITAGLMAGANNNGSRLTSQRIFGNANSTLFGADSVYNATNLPDELLSYAGYPDDVTDRNLQDVSVDAYVYDGTLTFGVKTDGNISTAKRTSPNTSGGDGWFKVDNFRIAKKGYVQSDALNVFYHFYNQLNEDLNLQMQQSIMDDADALYGKYQEIGSGSTQDDINNAIVDLRKQLTLINGSVNDYKRLETALLQHYASYEKYKAYEGGKAYQQAIEDAQDGYEQGTYDSAGIDAAIKAMDEALENCKINGVKVGGDLTNLIANPSFEDLSAQNNVGSSGLAAPPKGWTLILNGDTVTSTPSGTVENWCAINGGDGVNVTLDDGTVVTKQPTDGDNLWGIWTPSVPDVELSQVITGLPKGYYTVKADVMVQYNWAGNNITTQRIFANDCVEMFASDQYAVVPADVQQARDIDASGVDTLKHLTFANYTCEDGDATTSLLRAMQVRTGVQDDGILKLGFRTNGIDPNGNSYQNGSTVSGLGWFKVDNFRLTYDSANAPVNGIGGIKANGNVVGQEFYTVNGQRTATLQKGVNIIKTRLADGSVIVTKVVRR